MNKAQFLFKLVTVVSEIKLANPQSEGSRWAKAIESGRRAGFDLNINEMVNQNDLFQILLLLSDDSRCQVGTPEGVLEVQAHVELAWEYFNKRQKKANIESCF